MSDSAKKMPLPQVGAGEDHAAKVMREKIGDVHELQGGGGPGVVTHGAVTADQKALEAKIIDALRHVFDPEIPLNIYDLGLIYTLIIAPTNAVRVQMTLTAPGCPVAGSILAEVKRRIEAIAEIPAVEVELVWEPPWTRERLSEEARLTLGLM